MRIVSLTFALIDWLAAIMARLSAVIRPQLAELRFNRDANVLMIAALSMIPMMIGLGVCVDYARAQILMSRIGVVADAAALTGTSAQYLNQNKATTEAAMRQIFQTQVAKYTSFSYVPASDLTVDSTDVAGPGGTNVRTTTVTWKGKSLNMFSSILGSLSLAIAGNAQAKAGTVASINFYVMLDTSPSMLIANTTLGIYQMGLAMESMVSDQTVSKPCGLSLGELSCSCAFACHFRGIYQDIVLTDPSGKWLLLDRNYFDTKVVGLTGVYRVDPATQNVYDGNDVLIGTGCIQVSNNRPCGTYSSYYPVPFVVGNDSQSVMRINKVGGGTKDIPVMYADEFWFAKNYHLIWDTTATPITLRIDAELAAAQSLLAAAKAAEASPPTYKMQFFHLNYDAAPINPAVNNTMMDVKDIPSTVFDRPSGTLAPFLTPDQSNYPDNADITGKTPASPAPGAYDTRTVQALTTMYGLMDLNPGNGQVGQKPQEYLIIVTDGMMDDYSQGIQWGPRMFWNNNTLAQCAAIKAKNIQIAILYTTYDPKSTQPREPVDPSILAGISPALKTCSSTDAKTNLPMVYEVPANGDISSALVGIFSNAAGLSHLSQ